MLAAPVAGAGSPRQGGAQVTVPPATFVGDHSWMPAASRAAMAENDVYSTFLPRASHRTTFAELGLRCHVAVSRLVARPDPACN
jgi:hypothetical protein